MSLLNDDTSPLLQKTTLAEIASVASVSTATVDRVLNNRSHVRETTRQRVLQAKAALETGRRSSSRNRPWRLKVILPGDAGPSTEYLAQTLQTFGTLGNATIECEFVKKLEPALLARKLIAATGQGIDAVLFQALEHPRVTAAVEVLVQHRIPSLAMMSGLSNGQTIHTVGIDNRAAGRTAGYLMGRLTRQRGTVAVVIGADLYLGHEDREVGFRSAIRDGFKHIERVITLVGGDDRASTHRITKQAIVDNADLIGIYNAGAGNSCIASALRETGTSDEIVLIGHHLTEGSKAALLDGSMDIVLHMNLRAVAEQAIETVIAHLEKRDASPRTIHIEIVTRENLLGIQTNDAQLAKSGLAGQ